MKILTVIPIVLITGCAVGLTKEGSQTRAIENPEAYNCKYIATVTGSNSMGNTTAHDAQGAANDARNKAARAGGNAFKFAGTSGDSFSSTATVNVYNCEF